MTTEALAPDRRVLYGVAVICFANLLLEVLLTRIFSATMYYHFTFLAIALALFGLGASGVYVYVNADRFRPEHAREDMARYARRFAYATIVALVYVLANPIDILIVQGTNQVPIFTRRTLLQLLLLNGVTAVAFFNAGMIVALAIAHYRRHVDRVYFYDLGGAGLAALLLGPLLGVLGAPNLVLVVAVLAAIGGALFVPPRGVRGWGAIGVTGVLVLVNLAWPLIAVPTVKGVKAEKVVFEQWNVFSRVTVDEANEIKIDASAATHISSLAALPKTRPDREITALAYSMIEGGPEHALIIGPGGGRDVLHALAAGTRKVTGVEVNPIIARTIMKERFAAESGGLYADPRVDVVVDEGRSYIRRSRERYDVIQASLVDTWAATAAGAFALTENTLYTLEAFDDYYEHLTDRGVVTMTRWATGGGGESARLLILAAGALERRGVAPDQARKHIYYAVKDSWGTMLAKRTPFTEPELSRLDAAVAAAGWKTVLSPRTDGSHALERFVDAGAWSRAVTGEREDLTPPSDDRPFFFYFVKARDLFNLKRHFAPNSGRVSLNNPAIWILVAFGAVLALTLVFILLPLIAHRATILRGRGRDDALARIAGLGYFAVIGLAFMLVEMALLQKFAFFLGHPSNALLVVLFSILVGTALGARLSGRIPPARRVRAVLACGLGLALLCGVYAFVLAPALRQWVAWPWIGRVLLSGGLVAGCGVLMGFMLPLGVHLVSERHPDLVPWGWGLNGALSVLGTVGATIIAIHSGFTVTLVAGAIGYALAALIAVLQTRLSSRAPVA